MGETIFTYTNRSAETRKNLNYDLLEEQKNRNQNRRDAVIVSVSTVGAGFCATNALNFAGNVFVGGLYLATGLFFVCTIMLVIWSCHKFEKDINKARANLSSEFTGTPAYGKLPSLFFAVAVGLLVVVFVAHFAIEIAGSAKVDAAARQ